MSPHPPTHTRAFLLDQVIVGQVEDVVEKLREEWEGRAGYVDRREVVDAAEARLEILEGAVKLLRDAV